MTKRSVIAVVAVSLVVAVAGSAVAGKSAPADLERASAAQIAKKAKKLAKKALKIAKATSQEQGPQGDPGPQGNPGPQGPPGTVPTPTFSPLTLENGWTAGPPAYFPPGVAVDPNGRVHLRGLITPGTAVTLTTLPVNARPSKIVQVPIVTTGGDTQLLFIETDGTVSTQAFDVPLSFDGVSFHK